MIILENSINMIFYLTKIPPVVHDHSIQGIAKSVHHVPTSKNEKQKNFQA